MNDKNLVNDINNFFFKIIFYDFIFFIFSNFHFIKNVWHNCLIYLFSLVLKKLFCTSPEIWFQLVNKGVTNWYWCVMRLFCWSYCACVAGVVAPRRCSHAFWFMQWQLDDAFSCVVTGRSDRRAPFFHDVGGGAVAKHLSVKLLDCR